VLSGPREHARWIRDLLANTVLSQGSGERFSVTGPYAQELADRSHEVVTGIADAGYDVVGTLDDLLPPDPLPVTRSPDDASTEELMEAAIAAIVGLIAEAKRTGLRHQQQVDLLRARNSRGKPRPSLRRLVAAWRARRPRQRR
jgi:hypothetical protein